LSKRYRSSGQARSEVIVGYSVVHCVTGTIGAVALGPSWSIPASNWWATIEKIWAPTVHQPAEVLGAEVDELQAWSDGRVVRGVVGRAWPAGSVRSASCTGRAANAGVVRPWRSRAYIMPI
jgi:hypothetical protein